MSLQITNLCNSKCTMCSIWKIYRGVDREFLDRELTGAEWLCPVERSLAQGVESFDVTGGEPFLKDGITDILALMLRRTVFAECEAAENAPGNCSASWADCTRNIRNSASRSASPSWKRTSKRCPL